MVKQRRGGENVNTEQNIFETNLQKIAKKFGTYSSFYDIV
jgi:hypothetical protein